MSGSFDLPSNHVDLNTSERELSALLEPFTFIKSSPSKGLRTLVIEAFNTFLNVPLDQLGIITRVVDMLHNASLLLDDIEDNSELRRGKPCAHLLYGIPLTINSANMVLVMAYKEIASMPPRDNQSYLLQEILTQELFHLLTGQGLDILWRDTFRCPSEEEYIEMIKNKTGGLFRMAVRFMMVCSTTNAHMNLIKLSDSISVFFQIRDDLMNLISNDYGSAKGFAEDLSEGKFSFPVIHSIHANQSDTTILDALHTRPETPTLKLRTLDYLQHETKSFQYTIDVLTSLEERIRSDIAQMGGSPGLEGVMDILHVDSVLLSTSPWESPTTLSK